MITLHKPMGRGYHRLVLKSPEIARHAVPGQFVMLRVSENLDPLLARPFGIFSRSSSSLEIIYRVAGKGTSLLTRMESGHALSLLGPIGSGFPVPAKQTIPLLVSGGSGFPPLHFLLLQNEEPAHLFVGARNSECLPPASVLKSFRALTEKVHIATDDGSAGQKGVATDLLKDYLSGRELSSTPVVYACGPHAMMASASAIASAFGITCYVSVEERMACGLGVCMGCSIPMKSGGYKRACKDGPVFDSTIVNWSEGVLLPVPQMKR